MSTTLFDLAGAAGAADLAGRWPRDRVRWEHGDYDETGAATVIEHLQTVLEFSDVTSAVAPYSRPSTGAPLEQPAVSVSADVHVNLANAGGTPLGVVHRHLPDFKLRLVSTDGNHPARLSWTRFADGTSELVVMALPVELEPPVDMLYAPDPAPPPGPPTFDPTRPDSLEVRLGQEGETGSPSRIRCFVTLRVTRDREVLIEPTVPLSIGRCVFMSLPCRAVHDIGLFPDIAAAFRFDYSRESPIGWTADGGRSVLAGRLGADQGLVTVRTLDLDRDNPGVKSVYDLLAKNVDEVHPDLEVPLEDVALAFDAEGGFPIPAYPVYGYTGIRRAVNDDTDAAEAFDFRLAPVVLPIAGVAFVHLHRFLIGLTHELVLNFDLALTRTADSADAGAVTVNLTQDRVFLLGHAPAEPKRFFRMGDATMSLLAWRGGVHIEKLAHPDSPRWKFWKWADALFDFGLVSAESEGGKLAFRTRSGGNLDLVLRDTGWKDGKPSVDAWTPDGIDLQVLGARGFHIDEVGLVSTTQGAAYLKLSASYQVGGARETTGRPDSQQHPPGNGIWLRGLRIRVQDPDDREAPALAIDGIAISIKASDGSNVEGGGWLRDEIVEGNRVRELGFGIRIFKPAGATEFVFAGTLVKGSIESDDRTLEYLLAGVTLGPIPLGSFTALRGSILVARNYVPRLPAPSGVEQNLRLFNWYRAQPDGLVLPPGRLLGAWEPNPDSWTVGVGLRLIIANSSVIKLDAFGLWLKNPETWTLLIGLEVRFKDKQEPIGWFAIEYDDASGRWGATGGVAIGLTDVLEDDNLPALAELTGSVYVANEPRTIAIGHIEDVDSWLQFKVQYERFELLLRVGFCFYDYAGDPPITAYGFVVTGRGRFRIPRLTECKFLLEVAVLLGSFSSEGRSAGIRCTVTAALSIKVWRLRFGLRAKIAIEHIKPHPDAGTATLEFTIETPWWLPDIHISHTWELGGEPEIELADVADLPVNGAKALLPASGNAVDLAVPLPAGANGAGPYSLAQLAQLGPAAPGSEIFEALTPVPVHSVIAVDFAATMTDGLGTGETTPFAASRQENGELYADYELVELGVRRRARYGPDAGVWTTLLAPEDTSAADVDPVNDTVAELVAEFTPELSMRWDRDLVRAGKLDARRLLLNAATPFTLTTANPVADDALLNDPDATCCGKRRPLPWVRLDFESDEVGVRLPGVTPFPGGRAHVRWHGPRPPVVVTDGFTRRARIPLTGRAGTALATVRFDKPAARAWAQLQWSGAGPAAVRLELHRGLKTVAVENVVLDPLEQRVVELHDGEGSDELVIRLIGPGGPVPLPVLYVDALAYVGKDTLTAWLLGQVRCETGGTLASGTLAWLPNHDYEVSVTCHTTVGHDRVGEAAVPVAQTALFRTKGPPGLNMPETPGGDLAPFVEAAYPRSPERLLYRDEPILLVMNERFSPLAPAVDAPPTAPPERRQLLEWSMLIDEVGSGGRGTVATHSSPDWLSANRPQPGPPGPPGSRLDAVRSHVREARSLDPLIARLDAINRSPGNCQPHDPSLHTSRIFTCAPPADGWDHGVYRARVVQRGGPYAMRTAFEAEDLTALTMPGGAWSVEEGVLVAPGGEGEKWAVLGDPSWVHVHVAADLELGGGSAGLAVAVGGTGDAIVALADAATGRLRLERRRGGTAEAVDDTAFAAAGPVTLEVVAYDDEVVARCGDAEVRAQRRHQREGRVAVVGGAGVRVARLSVEPVEAYAIDALTSRWRTFDAHAAAYRDSAPLAIDASGAELAAWLAAEWDRIVAAMAADADPRTRGTVFRTALETLGIAAVEDPRDPVLTRLLAGSASVALLLEGPEPLPFSRDVRATLQRRPKKPFPFPHFPFDDLVVLDPGGGSPPTPPSSRPPPGFTIQPRPDVITVHDLEPLQPPVDPPQWLDVGTLVLTDDDERRAFVIPVDLPARTPLPLPGPAVRLRLELDRERYRSAGPDPAARAQATAVRTVTW